MGGGDTLETDQIIRRDWNVALSECQISTERGWQTDTLHSNEPSEDNWVGRALVVRPVLQHYPSSSTDIVGPGPWCPAVSENAMTQSCGLRGVQTGGLDWDLEQFVCSVFTFTGSTLPQPQLQLSQGKILSHLQLIQYLILDRIQCNVG